MVVLYAGDDRVNEAKTTQAYEESLPENFFFIVMSSIRPMCSSSAQVDKKRTNKAQPESSRGMYDPPLCRD